MSLYPLSVWRGALLCTALRACSALAGPPLQTEDAALLAPTECELEAGTEQLSRPNLGNETGLQIACGVGLGSQLSVALQNTRDSGLRAHGVLLAGKTLLWQGNAPDGALTPLLALAWQLAATRIDGEAWRHASSGVSLAWSQPLAAGSTLDLNLGHRQDRVAGRCSSSWGLALVASEVIAGSTPLLPVAEVHGDDRSAAWWNLGLRIVALAPRLFVNVAYGRQLSGDRVSRLTAGLSLAF